MPQSTVRIPVEQLELFLTLLPQTGAVVIGMHHRIHHPDIHLEIESDKFPAGSRLLAHFEPDRKPYCLPTLTLHLSQPVKDATVIMSNPAASDHSLDGLLPYQRHALEALEGEGKVFFPARSHSKSWLQGLFGPGKRSFSQRLRAVRDKAEAEIRKFDEQTAKRNNVSEKGQHVSDEPKS
ncbi:hypothetical protein ACRRRS_21995 (plasmid) [Brucella anthropi]|uniref:hypothetical protein n=1 Tax=Brucella anthropi TaxID=529 RepID=UPI003D7C63E1